ncbi:hypothetical protein VaNZ11_015417 [Volvox africanus]|uniref:RAVE complex protein Rav1 C-terminal domain-containing protein n=1 Tax=Volvox africanus TaxID=51714 RepID=A0ABQ5SMA2_9CHLO|nr:hypothetical protein VaNZ11_015417 [Volvox africanus]
MPLSATHGGQRPFLPATRSHPSRCQIIPPRMMRHLRPAATGGFHPDSVGASPAADATASTDHLANPASSAPSSRIVLLYVISLFGHLRGHASSLAQHLSRTQHAAILPHLGLGRGAHACLPGTEGNTEAGDRSDTFLALNLLQNASHLQSRHLDDALQPLSRQHASQNQHHNAGQSALDGRLWISFILSYVPWSSRAIPQGTDSTGHALGRATAPLSSAPSPSQLGQGEAHHILTVHTSGLEFLWLSAASLRQRAVITALWHMGQAVEAADKARRRFPSPEEMPGLVHLGAVAAAARAEETVALALARTATAASAAAAGVPAAAAGASSAPHLPLLHHARRRLLAAATLTLERLRGLQQGCTTHVLLRFLLYSALSPRLRQDLHVRLDVLARRAVQVALLQEQHDAWLARQPATQPPSPSPFQATNTLGSATVAGSNGASVVAHGSSIQEPFPSFGLPSAPPYLSARWYRRVFAPEMLACARQLELEAPGSPPDDQTAGDPPGRFDLRDLYRLIRVVEVAVEDLEHYEV